MENTYYVGWDVGAWNCTTSKSCDAIVILDANGADFGTPYRGNIRESLVETDTKAFLTNLFKLCGKEYDGSNCILAIDTPLGYSNAFRNLISGGIQNVGLKDLENFNHNPFVFRKTEVFIYDCGFNVLNPKKEKKKKRISPLSAVNHMIGSQSTKGILAISKFANKYIGNGIWESCDGKLTVIEGYPTLLKEGPAEKIKSIVLQFSPEFLEKIEHIKKEMMQKNQKEKETKAKNIELKLQDIKDAYLCARLAQMFSKKGTPIPPLDNNYTVYTIKDEQFYLIGPPFEENYNPNIPQEGWIWFVLDSEHKESLLKGEK